MGYSLFVTGLTHKDEKRAFPGCTLFTPMSGDSTHLINLDGEVVHRWRAPEGLKAYYATGLNNGNLLAQCIDGTEAGGQAGGRAAAVIELDWDGKVVWDYRNPHLHHDHHRRSNGNTILIAAEMLDSKTSAIFAGGDPGTPQGEILSESFIEVTPDGRTAWQWHAHEHLDPQIEWFRAGGGDQWLHCNAVEELPDGRIMASFNTLSEVVIIDRQSGDVVWRLKPGITMSQHNPTMLTNGNILLFDNGNRRNFSRVLEISPADQEIVWEFTGNPRDSFYSMNISGAQRLPNGNTLITEGRSARFFEVTPDKDIVWEYVSPFQVLHLGQLGRAVFRAHRYAEDSPFIRNRV
ncbi:MAG TPA: aryl-sulfate sulfotransferase [Dehalococcoidia bacterium]|nr:aryl-sulfate sulfotransferase [Dehalococcoidia bacterium]